MQMTVQLTIDCSDPQRMVAFWAEALGYVPEPPPGGHAAWRAHWGAMGVPEAELPAGAGDIPESKVAKNRWHFDMKVGGGRDVPLDVRTRRVKATVKRLLKAGATVLRTRDEPDTGFCAAAMQDPEGNEFDVV
ncbi:VOC family protein [Streptomyces sp. NPDC051172]|uniref:VOC family protein n=1 Tax=Streptomyces sp. NPDC051172 TaxID=3155796 RepID=UPI0034453ECF